MYIVLKAVIRGFYTDMDLSSQDWDLCQVDKMKGLNSIYKDSVVRVMEVKRKSLGEWGHQKPHSGKMKSHCLWIL